ncbi:MAG TPA: hypothetical protein IAD22_05930 [Candidatus Limousia pullorum]|uniref:Uncharacterized protein n=1 Tax=Candidatus Limousia pullorum TaxID=2840860 RepID=A0A9D1LYR0_9FIRM|nr:hypothetical protein [Candidatus Limousia pullorum]
MMKNKNLGYVVLSILLVFISIIAFVIPTEKTGTFWITYVFTTIAILAQIVIWKNTLGKEDTLKSKFLGLPVIHVGIVYLVVQIVAFAVFTAVPTLPIWSAIVACTSILCFSVVSMIAGEAGRGETEYVESKVQKKVFFIKELQTDVELLIDRETDIEIRTALQQLAEKIRFSDPMSDDTLSKIENTIAERVAELKTESDKMSIIHELDSLLAERNKKAKILK